MKLYKATLEISEGGDGPYKPKILYVSVEGAPEIVISAIEGILWNVKEEGVEVAEEHDPADEAADL